VTLALYLAIEKDSELGSKVCLHKHYEGPVSARLQGSLNDFFQLLSSKDKGTALINSGLTFSGDSQRVLKLQQTLAELDLDWEAQLAKLVGDVPGHFLGEGLKHLARFGQHSRDSFLRHLEEYLHEEGRLLPCRDELESYYHDVSMLQERSERLEAKIQRLQQRIQQRKS
jgi:ubiquinone biosynthesis protein UbiJ